MRRTLCTATLLALVASSGRARAFLPEDTFAWWGAQPPPTAPFTARDTIDAFFNPPIRHLVDFDVTHGWPDPQLVTVHRPGNAEATLVTRTTTEDGVSGSHLVLELPATSVDPEHPGGLPGNESALFDFASPQRAVLIQFGFRCVRESCTSSSGARGVDASGFELRAYDDRRNLLVTAPLPVRFDSTLAENRTDFVVGLRDVGGNIHRVELLLGNGNSRGDAVEAVLYVRKIIHEAFPHAAVRQMELEVDSPTLVHLPYHFNRATAVVRGFSLTEDTLFALTGFEYRVDAGVSGGSVVLTATGATKTEVDKSSTPLDRVYVSVIGWDDAQTELNVQDGFNSAGGEIAFEDFAFLLDPCRNNACGPAGPAPLFWPTVAMSFGQRFDMIDTRGDNDWDLTFLEQRPTFARDLALGQIQLSLVASAQRDGDPPVISVEARHRTLGGRSVVMPTTSFTEPLNIPTWITQTSSPDPIVQYTTADMSALGYDCPIDAPVAAVGARAFVLKGRGWVSSGPDRGTIPEAIDLQIKGELAGSGTLRSRVIGRLRNIAVGVGGDRAQGQVFVVPSCIGLKSIRRDVVTPVGGARFAALVGRTGGPEERGRISNLGPGSVTITGAKLSGTTAPFALDVFVNGVYRMPLANLRAANSVLLRPGDRLEIGGSFSPTVAQRVDASIRFSTNLPGGQAIDMGVTGRIPATAEWLPARLAFGFRELRSPDSRNALLAVNDVVPVTIRRFEVRNDPESNFTVVPEPPYRSPTTPGPPLNPGDATLVQVIFNPRTLGPGGAMSDKRAQVVAVTDVGDKILEVSGTAVPPPLPDATLLPSTVTLGLVPVDHVEEAMVTLGNAGAGTLTVSPPSLAGDAAFSLVPAAASWPATLGKDDSFTFTVRFAPTGADGPRGATLVIPTNDGPLVLPISGYAVGQ